MSHSADQTEAAFLERLHAEISAARRAEGRAVRPPFTKAEVSNAAAGLVCNAVCRARFQDRAQTLRLLVKALAEDGLTPTLD